MAEASSTPPFLYDVFLSHSSKDKPAVRALAERLRADGLRVWFDEWVIQPGDMIGLAVERGLEQSRTLVLAMSANALAAEWVMLERQTAMFRDPTNAQRRFIPLRLDDAPITDTLRQYLYIDWRQPSDDQYERVLTACRISGSPTSLPSLAFRPKEATLVLDGHTGDIFSVAVTADGRRIVSGSGDKTVRIWDLDTGRCVSALGGHKDRVFSVAVTADGRRVVSGSGDKTVRIWDLDTGQRIGILSGHTDRVFSVAVVPDGRRALSGSLDNTVRVWDLDSGRCITILEGHLNAVWRVAVMPDGRRALSGSRDNTVRVWDLDSGYCIAVLEGHTGEVNTVAITPDGRCAVSGSDDCTVRVWDLDSGHCIAVLKGHSNAVWSVTVTPDGRRVVSGSVDRTVRVWELPSLNDNLSESPSIRYTNAKVLLVGDTGVGKSGLALRLAHHRFEPTVSTDGAWATQFPLPQQERPDGIEREIWLWDFAGQSDQRLIHQLFMDETAVAVFVFNPQSDNPFEGLGQWDRDLQRAARRPFRKLLVAGRCDVGGLRVSRESIEQFCRQRGFAAYYETSALTDVGCDGLRTAIIDAVPWDDLAWTASLRIFKLLKDEILRLRDEGAVLLRIGELKQHLDLRLPGEAFTLDELRTVVGLLAGNGIVWQLEFGDFVVLQPERISAYASAMVRRVRAHPEQMGVIPEAGLLAGALQYDQTPRLPAADEQIILRALHLTLVQRQLCLVENSEQGPLLVFPSYFGRERPDQLDHPALLVSYSFSGPVDEIYATLVVRLRHTAAFQKGPLWRYSADFATQAGKPIGLQLLRKAEGAAEITVYAQPDIPDDTKVSFMLYIQEHLERAKVNVETRRYYVCLRTGCHTPINSHDAIRKRLDRGLTYILCPNCEQRVELVDLIQQKLLSPDAEARVRQLDEKARGSIDNESKELILVGHAFSIAGEAGQIFRPTSNSDWGIDGEIEFKNYQGQASGQRVYLQLKSGDSYLRQRKRDRKEIFGVDRRHAEYWQSHAYPVMLVVRTSTGDIRWMNVTEYLRQHGASTRQIVFEGEPFTAFNLVRLRDRLLG